MSTVDRTCPTCGGNFIGHPNKVFCSTTCKSAARKARQKTDIRSCLFAGCARPYYANGHCRAHYDQLRLGREYSSIEVRTTGPSIDRLEVYTDKTGACWLWKGAKNDAGYGQLSVDGRMQYTHRLSYELHVGPIPDGLQIDHLCRQTLCLRPDHLEVVTPRENLRRMRAYNDEQPRARGKFISKGETYTEAPKPVSEPHTTAHTVLSHECDLLNHDECVSVHCECPCGHPPKEEPEMNQTPNHENGRSER